MMFSLSFEAFAVGYRLNVNTSAIVSDPFTATQIITSAGNTHIPGWRKSDTIKITNRDGDSQIWRWVRPGTNGQMPTDKESSGAKIPLPDANYRYVGVPTHWLF